MNSPTTTGNKCVVTVIVYTLVLCFLVIGCSNKTDFNADNGPTTETVRGNVADPTKTTETTSAIVEEETQSNTEPLDYTIPDEEASSEVSAPSVESTEKPIDNPTATIPGTGDDESLSTEPATVPTDNTSPNTPENEGNDTPEYGIELPDDTWD